MPPGSADLGLFALTGALAFGDGSIDITARYSEALAGSFIDAVGFTDRRWKRQRGDGGRWLNGPGSKAAGDRFVGRDAHQILAGDLSTKLTCQADRVFTPGLEDDLGPGVGANGLLKFAAQLSAVLMGERQA